MGFRFLSVFWLLFLTVIVSAELSPIWDLRGFDIKNVTGTPEAAPGSASELDDHYYLAGSYPAPIGEVTENERQQNVESSVSREDPSVFIHFPLSAEQASSNDYLRFRLDFTYGRIAQQDEITEVSQKISFHLNGSSFFTSPIFLERSGLIADVPLSLPVAGENILEIRWLNGTPGGQILFSRIRLESDLGSGVDSDNDGIPSFWENSHFLSDQNPDDAGLDPDNDSLTNLQEFQKGTNPQLEDSDGDGLNDNLEIQSDPHLVDTDNDGLNDAEETSSQPNNPDSDGDGASDSWEIATGYDPSSSSSRPPAFQAIGLNINSDHGPDRGAWDAAATTGYIPQQNWNHTYPLFSQYTGSPPQPRFIIGVENISTPTSGVLTDASGQVSPITASISFHSAWSNRESGSTIHRLHNGYLKHIRGDSVSISFSEIPYSNYDVYVHLSSVYVDPGCSVRINNDPATTQTVVVRSIAPYHEFQLPAPNATDLDPFANVLKFENLTDSNLLIDLVESGEIAGISAVQIVNTIADADNDTIPDFWELKYATNASLSNASADHDGDQLSNLLEYQQGSNPNLVDTDSDGLSDLAEMQTGADPNNPDSDADGLSDGDEIHGLNPSNPTLADSDNDSVSDADEISGGSAASDASIGLHPQPQVANSTNFLWEIDNIQVLWDHTINPMSTGAPDSTFALARVNTQESHNLSLEIGLVENEVGVTYQFFAHASRAFRPRGSGSSVRAQGPSETDLSAAFGFSGYGNQDFSDLLTFHVSATAGPEGVSDWTLTFFIKNQRTNEIIHTQTFTDIVAAEGIRNGSVTWEGLHKMLPDQSSLNGNEATTVFRTLNSVEEYPQFEATRDLNNDGIADTWATENNITDPDADDDGDSLTNRQEYFAGTNPNNADSDGDMVRDNLELTNFSDPNDINSFPLFVSQRPATNGDFNRNGFRDSWEATYGVSSLTLDGDADGDGVSNKDESIAGTNPYDASSGLFLNIETINSEQLELRWPRLAYKAQDLNSSPTLTDWNPVSSSPTVGGTEYSLNVSTSEGASFFQTTVADLDTDLDGVTNAEEALLGSSPMEAHSISRPLIIDTDGDGIADGTTTGDYAALAHRFSGYTPSGVPTIASIVSSTDASRLLLQATFGPRMTDIQKVRKMGIEAWIDDQIQNKPTTLMTPLMRKFRDDREGQRLLSKQYNIAANGFMDESNISSSFARASISGPDQLRQRMAYALSQILVVSIRERGLNDKTVGIADYYDLLVNNAFGNYEDLLMKVTQHPVMGVYLSSIGNRPPDYSINRFPDENYAREVMQLFSIGLWQLNPDGTRQLDPQTGEPIPTYDTDDIMELARVMTGFWYAGEKFGTVRIAEHHFTEPMEMSAYFGRSIPASGSPFLLHDFDEKILLKEFIIPARTPTVKNALQDVRDAIHILVEHQNTPPFICQVLIQLLVTDNPSPAYVERVAAKFIDNGSGTRGDLGAVAKAILMDPEARDQGLVETNSGYGKLKDPLTRSMHLARLSGMDTYEDFVWYDHAELFASDAKQAPLASPSVFNFYRPDYTPPGVLTDNNLNSGPFEIIDNFTAVAFPNRIWQQANKGFESNRSVTSITSEIPVPHFRPSYGHLLPYANDADALLDYLSLTVCAGKMTAETRAAIKVALEGPHYSEAQHIIDRINLAIYLTFISPEGAVQR